MRAAARAYSASTACVPRTSGGEGGLFTAFPRILHAGRWTGCIRAALRSSEMRPLALATRVPWSGQHFFFCHPCHGHICLCPWPSRYPNADVLSGYFSRIPQSCLGHQKIDLAVGQLANCILLMGAHPDMSDVGSNH
jgi:hypothetical protein